MGKKEILKNKKNKNNYQRGQTRETDIKMSRERKIFFKKLIISNKNNKKRKQARVKIYFQIDDNLERQLFH